VWQLGTAPAGLPQLWLKEGFSRMQCTFFCFATRYATETLVSWLSAGVGSVTKSAAPVQLLFPSAAATAILNRGCLAYGPLSAVLVEL
jgi:hypothetical protein